MNRYNNVLDLVGNTPLFQLVLTHSECELYLKLEKFNPGQSVKDRAAKNMLLKAAAVGRIKPGDTIIESSSGNTGISLAMFAAACGYRFICVVDNHVAQEKIDIMRAYGAVIERVGQDLPPDYHAAQERLDRVKELLAEDTRAFFINQGDNLDNSEGHYLTTAQEIINQLPDVRYAFLSVGTGGSVSGTGRGLKECDPSITVIGVEPEGSILFGKPYKPFFQSGAGSSRLVWKNLDVSVVDYDFQVGDIEAFNTCRFLAQHVGLLVGGSGGALIYKAVEYLSQPGRRGTAVALVPDGGERYVGSVFNSEWMGRNGLLDHSVKDVMGSLVDVDLMRAWARNACPKSRAVSVEEPVRGASL